MLGSGKYENIRSAYSHDIFNGQIDIDTTMPLIVYPIKDQRNETIILGVIEVINVRGLEGISNTNKAKISKYDLETLEFFCK